MKLNDPDQSPIGSNEFSRFALNATSASAVAATKCGAVDFIQKTCTPGEIREFVSQTLIGKDSIKEATGLCIMI